ncbi:MAG: ImmA/IrrE family metallo-endopeptidase [Okeania sp. SIO2C9]|uniref:ImmA/IrrE family metallo-endopeptidase n=1 Tax=Okeania sp. SIO2C9 TaxID=2607791 RepID=UPI0013C25E63|nr:ImmA/IrrE family metallo-endopeptidase [Okeania sp. SIO2C9]NEQ71697.1 ImmA/IrrE family metallo-endopeptidase [Okeania sp. SIO2C9]
MSILKPYCFYRKESIERRANDILRRMHKTTNFAPRWPFEASLVADFLDLGVVWDEIPPDEGGAIAARILPTERLIELNEKILDKPQGFQESTLSHEIGHWVLHINQDEADGVVKQLELDLGDYGTPNQSEQPFVCRGASGSKIDSIEWQAQYFAGCLLMPKSILEEKRQGKDLTKWSNLYKIKDELGVSISNLTYRLQEFGWIYIPKGSRTIHRGSEEVQGQTQLFG